MNPQERTVAALLWWGTWIASAVIAVGLLLEAFNVPGLAIMNIGIGLVILLPIMRVLVMAAQYGKQREFRYAVLSLAVLLIIAAGIILGR